MALPEYAPLLLSSNVSEEEKDAVFHLRGVLSSALSKYRDIEAALVLFDHAHAEMASLLKAGEQMSPRGRLLVAWQRIAARDSALRIIDLEEALRAANGYLKDAPEFAQTCNRGAISKAFSLFDTHFPERAGVRNAAAHTADATKNARKRAKHTVSGSIDIPGFVRAENMAGGLIMTDNLLNRTYTATFDNKVVRHEMTQETSDRLAEILETFFSCFPER